MGNLRYFHKISILEFLLVSTGLALIIFVSARRLEAQAFPIDGHRNSPSLQLDHTQHDQLNSTLEHLTKSTGHLHLLKKLRLFNEQTQLLEGSPDSFTATSKSIPVQRIRHVVHETNKVILLTNGEQIKLYPLKEDDLSLPGGYYVIRSKLNFTANGSGRPLISDVGYAFDRRFCNAPKHTLLPNNNCLVIFWLDKRNKLFRYGSFIFTQSNHIELLSSKFNAYGNLKSLSDKNMKTIWLHEFPPIDLCKRADVLGLKILDCELSGMTVDSSIPELNISLNLSATDLDTTNCTMNNLIVTMSASIEGTPLVFKQVDISLNDKELEIPDAIAMTANNIKCQYFWLNANHELYSSNFAGQDVQFIEKLSSKPAIRSIGEIHSFRDIIFFSDMTTKSIMSYNMTQRADIARRNKPQEAPGRKKFDVVQRLDMTHHVILVETSPIQKFDIIDFDESSQREKMCKTQELDRPEEPRVIDDTLTDNLSKHRLNSDHGQHLLEDIMQLILIVLSILLVIFVITEKTRVKQVKSDRETFFKHENP